MSAGLHIGFSFQFQFTVVGLMATKGTEVTESRAAVLGDERLYLFASIIRTDVWVVKGEEGRSDGICGVGVRAECGWRGGMSAIEWRHSGNCLAWQCCCW